MASQNRIILVGRPTADPEVRTTIDTTPVAKFQLAVERQGGQREMDHMDIVAWGPLAENCGKFLSKGQLTLVEGRISNRSFDTKEGIKKYVTEIVARNVTFLEKSGEKKQVPVPAQEESVPDDSFLDDDLPF